MNEEVDILNEAIDNLQKDVIQSMQSHGRIASGETVREFQVVTSDNYAALYVPRYIDALEVGRKPTGSGAVKADPSVYERIKAWCAVKGIDPKAAGPITKSIHKKGYKGKPGVLSEPLSSDNVNRRLNPGLEKMATNFGHKVADLFDVFDTI